MLSLDRMPEYADSPMAFWEDIEVDCGRVAPFGQLMADFQRDWLSRLARSALALSRGEMPEFPRVLLEMTKGIGKDLYISLLILWLLAFSRVSRRIQLAAVDAEQADEMRLWARDTLRHNPLLAGRVEIQSDRLLCRATSSQADILAADVAGSHGSRPDLCVINEFSHVTKWEYVQNLLDNASKRPHGMVIIAGNAGMIDSEAWKLREMARELSLESSPRWLHLRYAQPAPWLDPREIAEAKRRNSLSRYNRLWWGIWSTGGDALDGDDINAAIRTDLAPMQGHQNGYGFVGALDLSVKQDHSAFVVLANHPLTQRIRLASCQNWKPETQGKVDLMAVEEAVFAAWRRFNLSVVAYDPYQCELMAQRLTRRGVRMAEYPFTPKNLDRMATVLLDVFRSRRIDLYPDQQLITDLGRLSVQERAYGQRLVAPRDEHGHADRAVALSIGLPFAMDVPAHVGQPWGGLIDMDRVQAESWRPSTFEMTSHLPRGGMPSIGPVIPNFN